MTLCIEEQVLGLQISIGDALMFVQKLENQHNLGSVESRSVLLETLGLAQVGKDFAARAVVKLCIPSAQAPGSRSNILTSM